MTKFYPTVFTYFRVYFNLLSIIYSCPIRNQPSLSTIVIFTKSIVFLKPLVYIFPLFLLVQSFYIQSYQPLRTTRYSVTNNNTIRIIFSIPARQYPVILIVSTKTKDLVRIRGGKVYGILQFFSRNNFFMRRFLSLKLVSLNSIRYIMSINVRFSSQKIEQLEVKFILSRFYHVQILFVFVQCLQYLLHCTRHMLQICICSWEIRKYKDSRNVYNLHECKEYINVVQHLMDDRKTI